MLRIILVCFVTLVGMSVARGEYRISDDRGGEIMQYLNAFASLRASGENVVIDGPCLSACTMVLGLIPRDRICASDRAVLGFHAAWHPGKNGRPIRSAIGTELLMVVYPQKVRSWLKRKGGLKRNLAYLRGTELYTFVAPCR